MGFDRNSRVICMANTGSTDSNRDRPLPQEPRFRDLIRRPVVWLFGVALAAVTAVLTSVVSGVLGNWVDPAKITDAVASGQPVRIAEAREFSSGWGFASARPILAAEVAAMPDQYGGGDPWAHYDWIVNHGLTNRLVDEVAVTLEGNRAVPVQITELRPHIQHCGPALSGSLFEDHPGLGPNDDPVLEVNLDARVPVFGDSSAGRDPRQPTPPYFKSHSITLARGEVVTLHITAKALVKTCTWDIEAEELVDGRHETHILGADDHWTVTGNADPAAYQSLYQPGARKYLDEEFTPATPAEICWKCHP